jgi:hypothetical protein
MICALRSPRLSGTEIDTAQKVASLAIGAKPLPCPDDEPGVRIGPLQVTFESRDDLLHRLFGIVVGTIEDPVRTVEILAKALPVDISANNRDDGFMVCECYIDFAITLTRGQRLRGHYKNQGPGSRKPSVDAVLPVSRRLDSESVNPYSLTPLAQPGFEVIDECHVLAESPVTDEGIQPGFLVGRRGLRRSGYETSAGRVKLPGRNLQTPVRGDDGLSGAISRSTLRRAV